MVVTMCPLSVHVVVTMVECVVDTIKDLLTSLITEPRMTYLIIATKNPTMVHILVMSTDYLEYTKKGLEKDLLMDCPMVVTNENLMSHRIMVLIGHMTAVAT